MTVPHITFPHRKQQACSLTQGKKMHFLYSKKAFYVIESFKISVMLTGLHTCPQAGKAAQECEMKSALCWWAQKLPVQTRGQGTVCAVHLSSLAASQPSAASSSFPCWKCPSSSFPFKILQKLLLFPAQRCSPSIPSGGGRGRKEAQNTKKPKQFSEF